VVVARRDKVIMVVQTLVMVEDIAQAEAAAQEVQVVEDLIIIDLEWVVMDF
jgi:hypothetical protein